MLVYFCLKFPRKESYLTVTLRVTKIRFHKEKLHVNETTVDNHYLPVCKRPEPTSYNVT